MSQDQEEPVSVQIPVWKIEDILKRVKDGITAKVPLDEEHLVMIRDAARLRKETLEYVVRQLGDCINYN